MKKIIGFLVIIFALTSCYDEYIKDYKHDAVFFAYQYDVRTVVVGEGMKFNFGVGLGGVMDNNRDRKVEYAIDPSLLSADNLAIMKASSLTYIKTAMGSVTALTLIPRNLYTVTDSSKFIINKGKNSGIVTFRADSAQFLANPNTLYPNYALPLVITSADADSIVYEKRNIIIGVKYENMLFGNYWHGGVTVVKNALDVPIDTIYYKTTIPSPEAKVWSLKTIAPFDLTINAYSNTSSSKPEIKISLAGDNVTIGSAAGSTYAYSADGSSTFNRAKLLQNRKLFLKYKYLKDGNMHYATDTLIFRNRIRDGVNEWQDENPSHY